MKLEGKKVVVTGGGHGIGRAIVDALDALRAHVVAIGRDRARLAELEEATAGRVETRAGDVRDPEFASRVMSETRPDAVVLNAGARPRLAPIHEHTWESFSAPWDTDVRATFHWCQVALRLPLAPGSTVLISSSGAAIGGSPMSGGYAGAKRMQWLLADYFQRESNALGRDIRFSATIPRTIVDGSEMGSEAIAAYAKAAGVTREKYLERFGGPCVTPDGVARGIVEILAGQPDAAAYVLLGGRVQPIGMSLSPNEMFSMK